MKGRLKIQIPGKQVINPVIQILAMKSGSLTLPLYIVTPHLFSVHSVFRQTSSLRSKLEKLER